MPKTTTSFSWAHSGNPGGKDGESVVWTEWGPPERMTTRGLSSAMAESVEVPEMHREKTERDRIRRVMRWVYWEPKSSIRTKSDFTAFGSIAIALCGGVWWLWCARV